MAPILQTISLTSLSCFILIKISLKFVRRVQINGLNGLSNSAHYAVIQDGSVLEGSDMSP